MAYDRSKLAGNVGVGATVPTLFLYNTEDDRATVGGAGYFNGSEDIFEVNDIILTTDSDGFEIYRISSNAGGVVAVELAKAEV